MQTKKITKIFKTSFVFLIFIFSGFFQNIGVYLFNYDINNLTPYNELILTAFSETMVFIILIILYYKDLIKDFKKLKKDFYKNMDITIKWWFIGIIVMVISNLIIGIFISNATAGNEESVQSLLKTSSPIALITFGLIGPVVEELVFRKAFKDIFKNKYTFILTSGLIFGSLHVVLSLTSLWDLFYLIPYCSLGIAFSIIYQKTNNIYYSMIMHILHNTVFSLVSILAIGVLL